MDESHVHDITRVIQLALAPAFLLTGIGSLLNVFANRLARIVDRSRTLERAGTPQGPAASEVAVLKRRSHFVRWAITLGTGAALFVTLVIGMSFLGFLLGVNFALPVAGLFVAAMAALTFALAFFLREVTLAIGSFDVLLRGGWRPARPHDDDGSTQGGA
jgi:hypothetical protein